MRLLQLELQRFRHFRDKRLVLADEKSPRGLSIIYGPNEAGKTTVLSAIRCFLFGFRDKSPELAIDFEQSELCVGARFELDNGRRFVATRTKGRKQTLFGQSVEGGEEFDEEWLHARLSRPSRAVFENVFGFSLDMLARGAESLKEHEVKSAIYGAGFGGNVDLEKLVHELRNERESLFKEGGKLPRINQLARALDERRRAVRQATTPSEEHRRLTEQLAAQRLMADRIYAEEAARRAEVERARAVLSAIEPFRALREAEAELSTLECPPGFTAERGRKHEELLGVRQQMLEALEDVEGRMREADERLAQLTADREVLGCEEGIDALAHDLGAYKKTLAERPRHAEKREELGRRTAEQLSAMHPVWDLTALSAMRVDALSRGDFLEVTAEHQRLRTERERWSQRASELEAMARQRELARRKLDLPHAPQGLDPAQMVVPPLAEVSRYEVLLAEAERELAGTRTRRAELKKQLSLHQEELSAIEAAGHAPAERDLESARARRQIGWKLVERALRDGAASVDDEAKRYGEGEPLPRAFERAVRVADEMADRMRLHADAVQKRALHEAAAARVKEQLADLEREVAVAERVQQGRLESWAAQWARAGIEPLAPASMRRWLEDRQIYVELDAALSEGIAKSKRDGERLDAEESDFRARFAALVTATGLSPETGVAKALRTVEDLAELRRTFLAEDRRLAGEIARCTREIEAFEARVRAMPLEGADTVEPVRAVERWQGRLDFSRTALQARNELERGRSADEQKAARLRARLAESEAKLEEVRKLAGQDDDEGVRKVTLVAARMEDLLRVADEQRRALRRAGARWEWESFSKEVAEAAPDVLEHRIAALEHEANALRGRASAAEQEVGESRAGLAHLDGGSRAAEEQAAAESERAALGDEVERYAVLTFAEEILHGSIRRFEREHQPRLLLRASEVFSVMTRGRYSRVERRLDGSLLVERRDGRTLLPDALSTGTREQLFIALRLAYVESYAKSAESLPMVLDDVLVNFDEERTSGALEALQAFAEKTQVLLFTCHARLVARVREVIPGAHHVEIVR